MKRQKKDRSRLPDGLPQLFLDRLKEIVSPDVFNKIFSEFHQERMPTIRINSLKTDRQMIADSLSDLEIAFRDVAWYSDAFTLPDVVVNDLMNMAITLDGRIYKQGLSSMLVAVILDARPQESVLDLCAAPGSKTAQIAAMMKNQGTIVANEAVKSRFYKLQSVVNLLGVKNVILKMMDGRKYRSSQQLFDRILVDAPCSSEGRFLVAKPKSYQYWSLRKIKEMSRKQRGLLFNASRMLKNGGTLVYSTCTFAPEENEVVVDWLLRKTDGRLCLEDITRQIAGYSIETCACLTQWNGRQLNAEIARCARIVPSQVMEGFFIARFKCKD